ncbi:hypothetical protein KY339_04785 [Candidatus Woesearchaeota archaeon]|nr:hypothetical protein [Candidatus Woesearchaeota archaeon]
MEEEIVITLDKELFGPILKKLKIYPAKEAKNKNELLEMCLFHCFCFCHHPHDETGGKKGFDVMADALDKPVIDCYLDLRDEYVEFKKKALAKKGKREKISFRLNKKRLEPLLKRLKKFPGKTSKNKNDLVGRCLFFCHHYCHHRHEDEDNKTGMEIMSAALGSTPAGCYKEFKRGYKEFKKTGSLEPY